MKSYNLTRFVGELLEEHQSSPASFTIKLYPDYWTLNNGSKCLYNNQMATLLDDIRAQRIPVDFLELFDAAKLPFYNGCMIVELQDFRPQKAAEPMLEEPQKSRVVLTPNPETIWADICLINQKAEGAWTDQEALEIEAGILLAVSPPLCLDPDPHLVRVANSILRTSTPTAPLSLKRKAAVMELEDEETEKARRAKLAQYMNPKYAKSAVTAPSYRILDAIERWKKKKDTPAAVAPSHPALPTTPAPGNLPRGNHQYPIVGVPAPMHTSAPALYSTPAVAVAGASTTAPPVPAPSSTPAPPAASGSQAVQDPKKKTTIPQAAQSPSMSRSSATPGLPSAPLPIPAHLQHHYPAHLGVQTPPRLSRSPHTPPNTASARSPPKADTRPPSTAPPHPNQSSQPTATTRSPAPYVQGAQFVAQAPFAKKNGSQQSTPVNGNMPLSNPHVGQPAQHLSQRPVGFPMWYGQPQVQGYPHHQQGAPLQHINQVPGPSTSPASRSPAAAVQGSPPQQSSPPAASQRLPSRSPMPPNLPQVQPTQAPHQPNYNYAALMQSQYNPAAAHLRPVAHGHVPHPQMLPHQLATGNGQQAAPAVSQSGPVASQEQAQAQAQAQAQMLPHYSQAMYAHYAQLQGGRYYPVPMGRGAPVVNGQHQMPGIPGHPQQMQLGANKAVQGGVQGS